MSSIPALMKKLLFVLPAVWCCIILTGCGSRPSSEPTHADSVRHAAALTPFFNSQLAGYFADTIPCADCAGIVTRLELKKDSCFILEQEYVGAKDSAAAVFYQLGEWTVVDSILRLSEITEGPRQFKIMQPDELKILDNEGAIITGTKLNYSLHRQSTAFQPKKNIPVRGMFAHTANSASRIKICPLGRDFPVVLAPAAQNMQAQYNTLKKTDKERILAEVEGRFENRPQGNATGDVFVIEKFNRFLPGEKCKE